MSKLGAELLAALRDQEHAIEREIAEIEWRGLEQAAQVEALKARRLETQKAIAVRSGIEQERAIVREMEALREQTPNPRDFRNWDLFYEAYDRHLAKLAALEKARQQLVQAMKGLRP